MPTNGYVDYQGNADDNYSLTGTVITAPDITTTEPDSIAFFIACGSSQTPTFDSPFTDTGWLTSYGSIGFQIVNPAGSTGGGTAHQGVNQPWAAGTFSLGLVGNSLPAFVQQANISGAWNSNTTATFGSNNTAGNIIMAIQISNTVITPSTPSLSDTRGNSYNHIIIGGSGSLPALDVWLAFNIHGGSNAVTVHPNGGFFANAILKVFELPVSIPDPTIFLQAIPSIISEGTSSTVSWVASNATSLTSNEFGSVPLSGSQLVTPPATDFYHFHADGPGGSADAVIEVEVLSNEAAFNLQKVILSMKQDRIPVRGKN